MARSLSFILVVAAALACSASALVLEPALRGAGMPKQIIGKNGVPICSEPGIFNATLNEMLVNSPDMPVQIVEIVAAIPLDTLWNYIKLADFVAWNPLFNTVQTQDIFLCGELNAVYNNGQFLARYLPANITAPHHVIQMGCDAKNTTCAFAWFFHLFEQPSNELITYGRHTFTFTDNGDGTTTVKSWEKAAGSNVVYNSIGWTNSLQESLHDAVLGILCMERVYQQNQALTASLVANNCMHFIV